MSLARSCYTENAKIIGASFEGDIFKSFSPIFDQKMNVSLIGTISDVASFCNSDAELIYDGIIATDLDMVPLFGL